MHDEAVANFPDEEYSKPEDTMQSGETLGRRAAQIGTPSLVMGFIQGACALLMATNAGKALLGLAAASTAAKASFLHSDPVRIPLMILSAFGALAVLYVLWNGWRLRNNQASRWRRQPLSRRERWSIGFALTCSLTTLALVVGEYFAHPIVTGARR